MKALIPDLFVVIAGCTQLATDGNTSSYSAAKIVTDSDGDGMPNKYEASYRFDHNSATDASLDSDGDGLTNLQEFRAGTDPRNPLSRFAISALDLAGSNPRVSFQSAAGKSYRIEFTDNVTTGSWKVLMDGVFTSTAALVQTSDPTPNTGRARFYRVAITP